MSKKLTNEQDVKSTQKSFDSDSKVLKFDENMKTPIYILDDSYEEGFVHWVKLPDGRSVRVVCGGGLDGKGFSPTNCKICNYLVEGYREARALEGEDAKEAQKIRDGLNRMRAKYSAEFVAVKGELLRIKDRATGKKTLSADFDEAEVGILALTQAQFNTLIGLVGDDRYPQMKSNADLLNRVILLDKRKRSKNGKDALYPTVEFQPLKNKSDAPDVEFDKDEFDTTKDFEIDEEKIEKAFNLLSGNTYEDDVDEEIEYEDEDADLEEESSEIDDDDIEDDDTDQENDLSDIEAEADNDDDDFEDDIPWEDDEEEIKPKKTRVKKTGVTRKKKVK